MTVTLRCEIFPPDLDATVDFYIRVLRFALDRDERHTTNPYVALRRGEVSLGAASRESAVARDQRRPPTGVELVLEVGADRCSWPGAGTAAPTRSGLLS